MATVEIRVEAEDDTEEGFSSAKQKLDGLKKSAAGTGDAYTKLASAGADTAQMLERSFSVMTRLDLVQLTIEQSSQRVSTAQERYNNALREFGAGSEEARSAMAELENAQRSMEKANMRAQISTGLIVVQVIQLAATMPRMIAQTWSAASAFIGAALAGQAFQVSTGNVIGAVVTATAVAVALGYALTSMGGAAGTASASMDQLSQTVSRLRSEAQEVDETPRWLYDMLHPTRSGAQVLNEYAEAMETFNKRRAENAELADKQIAQYAAERDEKALLASSDRARIQAYRDEQAAIEAKTDAEIRSGFVQERNLDLTIRQTQEAGRNREEAEAALSALDRQEKQAAADAKRQQDEAARAAQDVLRQAEQALSRIGVDLANIRVEALKGIAGGGFLGDLAQGAIAAHNAERDLARQIVQSGNPALLEQLSIAADKGETMEELAASIGLTKEQEAELQRQGRLTTEGLKSQEEVASGSAQTPTAGMSVSGAGGTGPIVRILAAAKGYDGMVDKPTLFLAGEAGREHVRVTPGGQGGGMSVGSLTQNFYGQTDEGAARRGTMDGLSLVMKRMASKRSF